jgi:hypothetical protein
MFRSLFLRLSVSLLPVTLFSFGLALSAMLVFANPNLVKSAVRDSGFYDVLIDDVFLQNQSVLGTALPVNDSGVTDAVKAAFTPNLLQKTGDSVVDGTYAWLRGDTKTPQFNVDLTSAKAQAADNVGAYVANRAASLPICSAAQARVFYSGSMDLYTLTCRPSDLSTETIHSMVQGSLMTSSDFFGGAFMTASSVQDQNGQPLYTRLSFIPTMYQWTIKAVYILGGISALAAVGVFFLSSPRRTGVKRIGVTTLAIGAVSTLFSILLGFISSYISEGITKISGSTDALQVKITDIVHILLTDVRYWWLRIAIAEVIIGIGLLVWLRVMRKPRLSPQPEPAALNGMPPTDPTAPTIPPQTPPVGEWQNRDNNRRLQL